MTVSVVWSKAMPSRFALIDQNPFACQSWKWTTE
jgi:hypothetical protein